MPTETTAADHNTVADHYTGEGHLVDRIDAALQAAGIDPARPTIDDLAPIDAFHIRGRNATEQLLEHASIRREHEVLDVGSGIGGTARLIASRFGCHVTGIDLTPDYGVVARELSDRVGLAEQTTFRQGSATDLPFEDASFDVAWTEHVQMNIADKQRFYGEIARVLKPGGQLLFHDVFAGPGGDDGFLYPVPWAAEASISHLASPDRVRALLESLGLTITHWQDTTAKSLTFFEDVLARAARGDRPTLGLHVIVGTDTAPAKFTNLRDNFAADRLRTIQVACRKA